MNMRIIFLSLFIVLVPVVTGVGTVFAAEHQHGKMLYTCPMHPDYVSDKPGSCPICGMDLVKKEQGKSSSGESSEAGIHISTGQQQLIGVKTDRVLRRELALNIRASARVVLDQELFEAQQAYLSSNVLTTAYFNPSRQKLLSLGMSDAEIDQVKGRRRADKNLLMVGLDQVWVYAVIYENEMNVVKPGQKVTLMSVAFPGEPFYGVVTGVAMAVDPQSRTVRVRIRVDDREKLLHPEMSLAAEIKVELGEKLSIAGDAVIDSGKRKIVHVMTGDEAFSAREVVLGHKASGFYEVISGLQEGEKVVVAGNFLVDAESQLKGNYDRKDN